MVVTVRVRLALQVAHDTSRHLHGGQGTAGVRIKESDQLISHIIQFSHTIS